MHINRQILHKATRFSMDDKGALELEDMLKQVKNWRSLIRAAELYGVANLLLKHITDNQLSIDNEAKISLQALSVRHRKSADVRYQVISDICTLFAEHKIPLVALKGLALAPMIYPEERFRPMRDMDILVPQNKEQEAAELLRKIGFNLPEQQSSKYLRGSHQLPNATKKVEGFTISVEVHHDCFSRDVVGHLRYQDVAPHLQVIKWRNLELQTLGHTQMLHHISRHLEGLHPGAVLKLINVLDVIAYCEAYINEIDWAEIHLHYLHVINTLHCIHLISPLSDKLQEKVGNLPITKPQGVGEIMLPLTRIINKRNSIKKQCNLLFKPSDWWLHLYYNIHPDKALWLTKIGRHPMRVITWFWQRLYSRIRGG